MRTNTDMELAGLTDLGCQRHNNEDSFTVWEPPSEDQLMKKGRLAIVADGMGGHEGGQEASRLAVDCIQKIYSTGSGDPQTLLSSGFAAAHQCIQEYAKAHPHLHGMGTTATAAVVFPSQLFFAHVGDSRLYMIRGGSITRLTHDHSYVGRLVENGVLSSEEAEGHPQRHILTAALGSGPDVVPDVSLSPVPLSAGDIIILCTDGLWGVVDDHEIQRIVSSASLPEACRQLIAAARAKGGPDNITVQLLRIG
jgi:protein phosphatase